MRAEKARQDELGLIGEAITSRTEMAGVAITAFEAALRKRWLVEREFYGRRSSRQKISACVTRSGGTSTVGI